MRESSSMPTPDSPESSGGRTIRLESVPLMGPETLAKVQRQIEEIRARLVALRAQPPDTANKEEIVDLEISLENLMAKKQRLIAQGASGAEKAFYEKGERGGIQQMKDDVSDSFEAMLKTLGMSEQQKINAARQALMGEIGVANVEDRKQLNTAEREANAIAIKLVQEVEAGRMTWQEAVQMGATELRKFWESR